MLVVYWKALQHVSAYEILAHRIVWSLVFTSILLTLYSIHALVTARRSAAAEPVKVPDFES